MWGKTQRLEPGFTFPSNTVRSTLTPTMNDPHVRALEYDFIPSESVDFKRAPPLRVETDLFSLTVESGKAVFEMKQHFPSVEAARKPIDEYIGAWLMQAYLAGQESEFSLVY